MYHYVYILKTVDGYIKKTYVGYSTNVIARLKKHNSSKGAKATKGFKWKVIYKKRFLRCSIVKRGQFQFKQNK